MQVITLLATGAYVSHSGADTITKSRCLRVSRSVIITVRNAGFTAFYWSLNNLFLSRLHERCARGECACVRVPLRDETSCIHGPKTRNKPQLELPRSLPLPPATTLLLIYRPPISSLRPRYSKNFAVNVVARDNGFMHRECLALIIRVSS